MEVKVPSNQHQLSLNLRYRHFLVDWYRLCQQVGGEYQ